MYTLLTGAFKNVGDLLIGERARQLLRHTTGTRHFLELNRWLPIGSRLDEVNSTDAVLLCGGPAYAPNFYPGIFPLIDDLDKIAPPIIPFGLGWSGAPGNPAEFQFTNVSADAIRKVHAGTKVSSCRGIVTQELLQTLGITNVLMTGCPAWYELNHIGQPLRIPSSINSVAVSVAPGHQALAPQQLQFLRALRQGLSKATIFVVFQRGISADGFTSVAEGNVNESIAHEAEKMGCEIVDASYDLTRLDFYHTVDLHIGYRVHSHFYFLSIRRPSILIEIDGRGSEANRSLGMRGVSALKPEAPMEALDMLVDELNNGFQNSRIGVETIESTFPVMQEFLNSLPRRGSTVE